MVGIAYAKEFGVMIADRYYESSKDAVSIQTTLVKKKKIHTFI